MPDIVSGIVSVEYLSALEATTIISMADLEKGVELNVIKPRWFSGRMMFKKSELLWLRSKLD